MPVENEARRRAEPVGLIRRFPRVVWSFGSAPRHPDIDRENLEPSQPNEQGNPAPHVHHITVTVLLNSGLVGGVTAFEKLVLRTDISFVDFCTRVCEKMGLECHNATLGYKFNKNLRRDPYRALRNEEDLRAAMAEGANMIERARTRPVELEIQNLSSAQQMAITSAGKRKSTGDDRTTQLPVTNAVKRVKTTASTTASSSSRSTIQINIANYMPLGDLGGHNRSALSAVDTNLQRIPIRNTDTSSSVDSGYSNCASIPASPVADEQQRLSDHSHTSASPGGDLPLPANVSYPAISAVLTDLHNVMPYFNVLQYEMALMDCGIRTVDDVRTVDDDVFIGIGMPEGVLGPFRDCAMRVALMAKGESISQPRY